MAKKKNTQMQVSNKSKKIQRMPLKDDGNCCICYNQMLETECLTYCKACCGHNFHNNCLKRWAMHNKSELKKISCPFCRCDLGTNVIENLKKEKLLFKETKKNENMFKGKAESAGPVRKVKMKKISTEKYFKCTCCKRQLIINAENMYHCLLCENMNLCSICYNSGFHLNHPFIIKFSNEKEWRAVKDNCPNQGGSHISKLIKELETREIRPDDYELLLKLDEKSDENLSSFLIQIIKKEHMDGVHRRSELENCSKCGEDIPDSIPSVGVTIPCGDWIHFSCLESMLQKEQYFCSKHNDIFFLLGMKSLFTFKEIVPQKKKPEIDQENIIEEFKNKYNENQFSIKGKGLILEEVKSNSYNQNILKDVKSSSIYNRKPPRDFKIRKLEKIQQIRMPQIGNTLLDTNFLNIAGIKLSSALPDLMVQPDEVPSIEDHKVCEVNNNAKKNNRIRFQNSQTNMYSFKRTSSKKEKVPLILRPINPQISTNSISLGHDQ